MPTYEYACKACGNHVDVVQSFTDEPLTTCESCGGSLRKVFGSIGISFKGSGFYKNDSRSSENGATKKDPVPKTEPVKTGDGASSTTSDSSSSPKAETSPAKTPASSATSAAS